ncbi:MAG TPA: hypothetical protein DDX54_03540 [Rhodospirillaceae bacterium]|jgi:hypothetical protein|nr:hypothetical protein [Alphaproteobacteria bacterium]HBH26457.1 hypothetical protein [Rhodospirillaceae bacterium]
MLPWWLLALLSSATAACDAGLNRYFRAEPWGLALWASVAQSVILAPVLFFAPDWSVLFLAAAVLGGALLTIFDVTIFRVAAEYGGAAIPRVLAARVWMTFMIWAAIDWPHTAALLAEPARALGILGSLTAAAVCAAVMNRCPATRTVAVALLPALGATVAQAILLKLALTTVAPALSSAALYALVTSAVEAALCAALMARRGRRIALRPYLPAAAVMGATSAGTITLRFGAFVGAPNPGYIYAIALLSAVWLWAWHALRGIPDGRSPWAGLGLVASAAVLIWLAR